MSGYIANSDQKYLKNVKTSSIACGIMNMVGNKGGVQLRFTLYDNKFNFINSHLMAFVGNKKGRCSMYAKINKEIQNEKNGLEADIESDFSYLIGDLNFRLQLSFTEFVAKYNGRWTDAHKYMDELDELCEARKVDHKFPGFEEAPITHKPTYKCHKTNNDDDSFVNKKNQCASFTDRIMFKNNTPASWRFHKYDSIPHVHNSDHRPIFLD